MNSGALSAHHLECRTSPNSWSKHCLRSISFSPFGRRIANPTEWLSRRRSHNDTAVQLLQNPFRFECETITRTPQSVRLGFTSILALHIATHHFVPRRASIYPIFKEEKSLSPGCWRILGPDMTPLSHASFCRSEHIAML